jgi:hypothetical protein
MFWTVAEAADYRIDLQIRYVTYGVKQLFCIMIDSIKNELDFILILRSFTLDKPDCNSCLMPTCIPRVIYFTDAVRKNQLTPGVTNKEVEQCIKIWLRNAPDRTGWMTGRVTRMKKKIRQQEDRSGCPVSRSRSGLRSRRQDGRSRSRSKSNMSHKSRRRGDQSQANASSCSRSESEASCSSTASSQSRQSQTGSTF